MKKKYISPVCTIYALETECGLLATSVDPNQETEDRWTQKKNNVSSDIWSNMRDSEEDF
ncbi:MAG: hypothetical protein ACI3X6_07010 [Alloprevotella sp.]